MDNTVLSRPHETTTDPAVLAAALGGERAPDIVDALNERTPGVAAGVLQGLAPEKAIEVSRSARSGLAGGDRRGLRRNARLQMCTRAELHLYSLTGR